MFGPIMRFPVGTLTIELAPIEREEMPLFVANGGMQSHIVSRYLGRAGFAPVTEDEYEWFDKVRSNDTSRNWGIYVVDGEQRLLIGNTSIDGIGGIHMRSATTGCLIFRSEYWGKGIASKCHRVRTWYACTQLGLVELRSAVFDGNDASYRALEKVGYVPIFHERNQHMVDGAYMGVTNFSLVNPLKPQWNFWWHGDPVPQEFQKARQRSRQALNWAERHVSFG